MNNFFIIFIIFLFTLNAYTRENGETEITTDDGIEVFQNEKFYKLKKNVRIVSDNFILNADNVKINFDKNLYDITELNAKGNVNFDSQEFGMKGNGEDLKFEVKSEKIRVQGKSSKLFNENIKMFSDGVIEVDNLNGNFYLNGLNSKLISETILIKAENINGSFSNMIDKNEITLLNVTDEKISYVKNNDTEMYAKKIKFNNETSVIELTDSVTIIRNEEKITGDFGTLDTKNNSYKIKSNNETKVRVLIKNDEQ